MPENASYDHGKRRSRSRFFFLKLEKGDILRITLVNSVLKIKKIKIVCFLG
jgi:hypothetical protein